MNLEKLLTREQKEDIIRANVTGLYDGPFTLRYDRRFGWDFEVRAHGQKPIAIFSVSITNPRFAAAVHELARALNDVSKGLTDATRVRGGPNIEA